MGSYLLRGRGAGGTVFLASPVLSVFAAPVVCSSLRSGCSFVCCDIVRPRFPARRARRRILLRRTVCPPASAAAPLTGAHAVVATAAIRATSVRACAAFEGNSSRDNVSTIFKGLLDKAFVSLLFRFPASVSDFPLARTQRVGRRARQRSLPRSRLSQTVRNSLLKPSPARNDFAPLRLDYLSEKVYFKPPSRLVEPP